MGKLSVRIVVPSPADCAKLTEIAFAAKAHWGYPPSWLRRWAGQLTMTPARLAATFTRAAKSAGQLIGFYTLEEGGSTLVLDQLWVRADRMGQGVGRKMVMHAICRAARLGATHLQIESDPNAEGFYQKMGAKRVGWSQSRVEGQIRRLPVE